MSLHTENNLGGAKSVNLAAGTSLALNSYSQKVKTLVLNGATIDFGAGGGFAVLQAESLMGSGADFTNMEVNIGAGQGDRIVIDNPLSAGANYTLLFNSISGNPNGTEAPFVVVQVAGANQAVFTSAGLDQGAFHYDVATSGNNIVLVTTGLSSAGQAVAGVPGTQNIMWLSGQDNVNKRMGDLRLGKQSLSDSWLDNAWVRSYGEQSNVSTGVSGRSFRVQLWGVDIGVDKAWELDSGNRLYTGVFAGYAGANQDFRTSYGSNGESDAISGGAYLSWLEQSGWYADAVFKVARYDNSFDARDQNYNSTTGDFENWGIGGSVEIGKQFGFADGWFAEPSVQLSYVHFLNEDYTTGGFNGIRIDQNDADVLQFRAGARFGRNINLPNGGVFQPYIKVAGVEQISSGGDVYLGPVESRPNTDGVRAEIGLGIVWQIDEVNQLHLDYEASFGDKYDKPWGLNFGYRHQF